MYFLGLNMLRNLLPVTVNPGNSSDSMCKWNNWLDLMVLSYRSKYDAITASSQSGKYMIFQ